MKEMRIDRPGFNLDQLTGELFEAFPGWRRPSGLMPGAYETDVRVAAEGDSVRLFVPDGTDEPDVRAVVEAHEPRERPSAPTADGVIAALASMNLEGVTTVAGLKEAIAPIRDAALAVVEDQGGN